MKHTLYYLLIVVLAVFSSCKEKTEKAIEKTQTKPNILFISVDDLRPELNAFGASQIISPHIDRLANDAMTFNRAYCNMPVCGASRASILTGIYPTPTRFTDYKTRVDEEAPKVTYLPEYFKQQGYFTSTIGKIFHHPDDGMRSWSETPYRPDYPNDIAQQELWRDYQNKENAWTKTTDLPLGGAGPAWEVGEVTDSAYYDGKTTELALKKLEELTQKDEPFFFGLGYIRPHLPFVAPKKYWDLYDPQTIMLPEHPNLPKDSPAGAWHNFEELRAYANIANDTLPIPKDQVLKLRHGYYACVSYIDAQIGQVVDKLKELGQYENTIIVIWGDHGWSLGEHGLWCKHSCLEKALRTTLIIKPQGSDKVGSSDALVSLIDVYPTLSDMAGLEIPDHLKGKSLAPLFENPNEKINDYLFSRYENGETVKGDRYIYTQYFDADGKFESHMLYDHKNDPEETINIVDASEHAETVARLKAALKKHMTDRS
ncbi:sulfatase [Ulvibacterium marinum]|uniref:DUF4976 domain-containing protein n=1 Tax=Ulvibacterium marinum TaxID=2419782 RepID=A0A3B0CGX3_9FLAO|nr:sulfatase [Ulvibacterium marinum]RKN83447.1 DUF4976 domain-containing protein [Ulvibacterium marinum]